MTAFIEQIATWRLCAAKHRQKKNQTRFVEKIEIKSVKFNNISCHVLELSLT